MSDKLCQRQKTVKTLYFIRAIKQHIFYIYYNSAFYSQENGP